MLPPHNCSSWPTPRADRVTSHGPRSGLSPCPPAACPRPRPTSPRGCRCRRLPSSIPAGIIHSSITVLCIHYSLFLNDPPAQCWRQRPPWPAGPRPHTEVNILHDIWRKIKHFEQKTDEKHSPLSLRFVIG